MLPYEYSVILKALKTLHVADINVYFEASAVSNRGLNGHVHQISRFFNKRFFKYSETGREYHAESTKSLVADGKSLFISEGNLLPSKTELQMAEKCKFDLYTITNLSFSEIAEYLSMRINLFGVAKNDLGDLSEVVPEFISNTQHFKAENKFDGAEENP